jgi:chorismate synthase
MKGVEIGAGFHSTTLSGSQVHDVIEPFDGSKERAWKRASNHAGGMEGGMTNGEDVVVSVAVKPISTLANPLPSVDLDTGEKIQAHYERSDVCQVPPAGIIGEAMLAIVLADAFLEKFGGDHLEETRRNYQGFLKTVFQRP